MFTLTNPSAITFPRINANNTVTALNSTDFRTAIGAGTSSTTGTVTSVSALTLGTTGTDLSSTVATSTTTPVITLNVPTASALNRGALSSSDWGNFNTAYTNRITSLTTNNSSGAATLSANALNVPNYTLAGLGGIKLTDLSSSATGLTYTNTTGAFSFTAGYSIPTTAKQTNWDTAYTQTQQWSGGSTNLIASTGRTSLGATTVGSNLFTLTNPTAITFPRFNADNTVSSLDAASFRTAIGAGTSSTTGTVTSVAALTLGTTGTDVSSTVATGTTTPVITLNVPTASATNRGALSSADWTNFNSGFTQRLQWDGGATNLVAATGRTSLGLVIGTNVQAWDADLDAIAALTGTTGLLKKTALNTWSLDTSAYLTSNQTVTLSGDVTGSGTTSISTTLGTVPVSKGGTGLTTLTANNIILGNGTSSPTFVAPGTSGNLLTSNGTTWQSSALSSGSLVPTGTLMPYAGSTAPSGYLLCDGSNVSRGLYGALFGVISTTYGVGDGATTFGIPDMRGRFPMGSGTGVGLNNSGSGRTTGAAMTPRTAGEFLGEETHLLTEAELATHTHPNAVFGGSTSDAGTHTHSVDRAAWTNNGSAPYTFTGGGSNIALQNIGLSTAPNHNHSFSPTITNVAAGLNNRHATIPPCIVLNYIIKT
jgi:microcystin-dependent protein